MFTFDNAMKNNNVKTIDIFFECELFPLPDAGGCRRHQCELCIADCQLLSDRLTDCSEPVSDAIVSNFRPPPASPARPQCD